MIGTCTAEHEVRLNDTIIETGTERYRFARTMTGQRQTKKEHRGRPAGGI
ncbi:hypothetical protein ABZ490_40680 [Streptomyces sp. NPDC005811]